jgi:uncharacterized membrane protein
MNGVKGGLTSLLFLGYPLIIYLLLLYRLQWLVVCLILCLFVFRVHQQPNKLALILLASVFVLLVGVLFGADVLAKLSPLIIHSGLFYLFWSSLKTTPLIERFARLDFPELPPEIEVYTRQLTKVWCVFFAANILGCSWLALTDNNALWALYNGFIVYLLIGALILGEYYWRRIRFPDLEIPSLIQSTNNIIKNGHKVWGSEKNEPN